MFEALRDRYTGKNLPTWIRDLHERFKPLIADVTETNLLLHAGSMAYISLGSIIPSLAVVFAIISIFQPLADPQANWFAQFRELILSNLTPQAGEQMVEYMNTFLNNLDVTRIGVTGFVFLFIIVVLLLRNIEVALNAVWQVSNERAFFVRFLYFWIAITLGALGLSIGISLFAKFGAQSWLPTVEGGAEGGAPGTSAVTNAALSFLFFSVLHKIGPNCYVSFKAAVAGGLAATIMTRIASAGFEVYTHYSDWNQNIYEALAVVPLFLLWLYIAWLITMFSAIIAWRTQHGFRVSRASPMESSSHIAEEARLRSIQTRALLPMLCVLIVGHRFQEGQGSGMTGREIIQSLDIPPPWVREGILAAESRGLLVIERSHESAGKTQDDILELQIFPTFPLDQLKVAHLVNQLSHDTVEWLDKRRVELPFDLKAVLGSVYESLKIDQGNQSLQSLFKKTSVISGPAKS